MRLLAAALAIALTPLAAGSGSEPAGRLLVTVGGAVPAGNLPARALDDGGLFGHLEIAYGAATGFDDAALAALPQTRLEQNHLDAGRMALSGPLLADVLAAAGAAGRDVSVAALDGYRADISWRTIKRRRPILAIRASGVPLPLGGFGPAAIVFPNPGAAALPKEVEDQQVWGVVYIEVR